MKKLLLLPALFLCGLLHAQTFFTAGGFTMPTNTNMVFGVKANGDPVAFLVGTDGKLQTASSGGSGGGGGMFTAPPSILVGGYNLPANGNMAAGVTSLGVPVPILCDDTGAVVISGGGGGSGTVTSIPDGSTNGVTWTVATRTTTPTFTFSLGAITPSSVSTAGSVTTGVGGTVAGTLGMGQGTAPSVVANTVQRIAGTSVTGYNVVEESSVGVTGYYKGTVSGTTTTTTKVATIPAADIAVGALGDGMTATTQSAATNTTRVATGAYADNAALATHLGTFAAPNTAAGAITWTSPVYNIYTSAGSTRTYTLPAASTYVNRAFILNVAVGTGHVNVQPASGAALVLAGVLLTADHYVQAATSAPGNYICFVSDGTNWTTLGSSGTWTDAASP